MTMKAPKTGGRLDARTLLAAAAHDLAERDGTRRDAAPSTAASRMTAPRATARKATTARANAPRPAVARAVAPRTVSPPVAAPSSEQHAEAPGSTKTPFAPTRATTLQEQPPGWQTQDPAISADQTGQGPTWSPQPPPYSQPVAGSKADSAFVLGIISLFLNVFYVPGILAIVWGGRERHQNSKARTGFVCGIIGTTLSALATLLFVVIFAVAGNAANEAANSLAVTDNASPGIAAGSTEAAYNVGDTASTGGFKVTVYGFKDPQPPVNEFMTPGPGMRYVSVDVQMTNPGSKQQRFSSMLGFRLIDGQNRQYNENFMDAGLTPGAPGGEFAAGQSVRGYVAFEVPDGTSGLKLRAQGNLTAAGAVFNLT